MKLLYRGKLHVSVLLYLAGAASAVFAQTPTVDLQFVSFPKSMNPEPIELLIGEEKTLEVEIPTNSFSKIYKVPALSTWALGKSSFDEDNQFTFQAYGKAKSIATNKLLILLIRKGENNADGFEVIVLKNNEDGLSGGKYLIMNASDVDIAGAIGTGKFSLKPKKYGLIAPKPTKSKGDRKYCFAKFYYRTKKETQPFFSSTWRFNEKARSMVFFYHDPHTKRIRVHTIRSFLR